MLSIPPGTKRPFKARLNLTEWSKIRKTPSVVSSPGIVYVGRCFLIYDAF